MRIPKYWAKGVQTAQGAGGAQATFSCWQWSDHSLEDAQHKAETRAREIALKIANKMMLNRYIYGDRPLREETLQSVTNGAGKQIAVVTRNAYGAQILNTENAMFIDIDFPKTEKAQARGFGLFGRRSPAEKSDPETLYTQKVADWATGYRDLGIRVYRTLAGLRCLITNQLFDPTQAQTLNILQALGSDPLYVRLCQVQECFRARLTPKPWRCGATEPPTSYPWENSRAEMEYRQWERRYEQISSAFATCRLVMRLGPETVHPDILPILSLHDRLACSDQTSTLA